MNLPNDFVHVKDMPDASQYYITGRHLTTEEINSLNEAGISFTITPHTDFNYHYLGTIVTVFHTKSKIEAGSSFIFEPNTQSIRWSRKR